MGDRSVQASAERLRLLECWLPFAQALAEEQGWGDDGAALAALVLAAGGQLRGAAGAAEARAILLVYHARRGGDQ